MAPIVLTPHQIEAIEWVMEQLAGGSDLCAVRGLAGTGKTTLLPALRDHLARHGITAAIGAPTHRAAMILRRKGLDAGTVHGLALRPSFSLDYQRACQWLGSPVASLPYEDEVLHTDVEDVPWLVAEALNYNLDEARALKQQRQIYSAKRLLE